MMCKGDATYTSMKLDSSLKFNVMFVYFVKYVFLKEQRI